MSSWDLDKILGLDADIENARANHSVKAQYSMARLKCKKATSSDASPKATETVAIMKDELAESNNDESATAISVSEVELSKEGNTDDVQDEIAEESDTKGATQDGVIEPKEKDKTTLVLAVSECEINETADAVADSADAPANEECTKKVAKVVEMEAIVSTIVANVVTDGVEKKDAKEDIVEEEKTDNNETEKVDEADTKVKVKNVKRAFKKKKMKRVKKKRQPVAGGAAKDSVDETKTAAAGVGSTSGTKTEDGNVGEENKEGDGKVENGLRSEDGKVMEVGMKDEGKADVNLDNAATKKSKKIKKKKIPVSGASTFGTAASNDANDVNKSKTHDEATGHASPVNGEDKYGASVSKKKDSKKKEGMGLIFMCSSKTKKDCYKYKVLGMPESKKEIVDKIRKGMRLFLFDIDLRLMYGIYKAASPGGYNIEPKAFKSAFPCQVHFSVLNDCKPLPEEKFKAVLKKNYYTRNKFSCQLSPEQVKNLIKLFLKENRPSKITQSTRRFAGAVEEQSPDRGKKRTRLVISANDVDSGRRHVASRRDFKTRRRPRPIEAKRLHTEGHRDPERKRRAAEDHRDLVLKRRRTEGRRDSERKRMRYSDDTRDSQYRRLNVEDTRDKEYRRPRDTYERDRYQSPPPPRQVPLPPTQLPSYIYERPAVADDYYYKREPGVELRDRYDSYRESIGYRYAYTSSYRDPVAYRDATYPGSLSSASYVAGPSTDVYLSGSSSAVYAPGSASAVYAPGSSLAVHAPGSASAVYPRGSESAVYAPGSLSAAYPEHTTLYRY